MIDGSLVLSFNLQKWNTVTEREGFDPFQSYTGLSYLPWILLQGQSIKQSKAKLGVG